MQLHLETDELGLLADLLMVPAGDKRSPSQERLLEMVLARELRFDSDELERLGDLFGSRRTAYEE